MQQQFFTGSMPGDESFGSLTSQPLLAHTPTTSTMLAALQSDSYGSTTLDPTSSAFNTDYGTMSYMDPSAGQDDTGHPSALSFSDFAGSGSTFDVGSFNPSDLGVGGSVTTPGSESEHDQQQQPPSQEPVKTES